MLDASFASRAAQGLDILFTPISTSHLLMFAGSNLTHEPTRKDGMVPRFARLWKDGPAGR
jgi:hypothetical protein